MVSKLSNETVDQERGRDIWRIVELFYGSYIHFREQFERYEWRVLQHSFKKGLDRLDLRLNPDDLAALLDFKALERLRDGSIHELKDTCHVVFRNHSHTDALDRSVSDIFHEMSILKEEHYNVKTYAPQYAEASAQTELSYIMDEAHTMFPKKLNQIRFLYQQAQKRMEELLPTFTGYKLFIRSLYLHRDDFVRECYENGIQNFYAFMYPKGGTVEGFYETGRSFFHSGFYSRAEEAMRLARAELQKVEPVDSETKSHFESLGMAIDEKIGLLEAARENPMKETTARLDAAAGLTG